VAWILAEASTGASLTSTGLFAAPSAPGTYHVIATSLLNPNRYAMATVVVEGGLAIDPREATLLPGASLLFDPSVPGHSGPSVGWTVPPGSGTFHGNLFTAPLAPGRYTLTATSLADANLSAQAVVTVKDTDLDGDGRTRLDFDDLAALADAFGTGADKADFDGDGQVGEADVALFLSRFEADPDLKVDGKGL
jgi:hypothetical protein